jgi:hypothetical protein
MNNLPALLGSAASNALINQGASAASKLITPIAAQTITQAAAPEIGKIFSGSAVPVIRNALDGYGQAIANNALKPEIAKSLSQMLPQGSGSNIEGLFDPLSSGVRLPEAKYTPATFSDYFGAASLGDALQQGDMIDVDILNKSLPPSLRNPLRQGVANLAADIDPENIGWGAVTSKSQLPKIKTSEYSKATGYKGEDIPKYMRQFLSEENGRSFLDSSWGEVFPDMVSEGEGGMFTGTPDDILARYEMYGTSDARNIYTPENYARYLAMDKDMAKQVEDYLVKDIDGRPLNVPISSVSSPSESIAVSGLKTPETIKAAQETVAAAPQATFQQTTRNLEDVLGTDAGGAGQGGAGGGVTITPPSPEDAGFNVPLETNESGEKVIRVNPQAARTTAAQKKASFQNRKWLDSMNATSKQYEMALSKSNSYGGHYKTPAERALANGLNPANIGERLDSMIAARQTPLAQAERYATEKGVRVTLPKLELTQAQAQGLAQNGVDIQSIIAEGTATPEEAEKIYKTLRDDGYRLMKATDGTSQERGRALVNSSKAVSDALDNTMDSLGLNYKDALLKNAAAAGEDQSYLQTIANGKEFKFSDLRRDMSDLIRLQDLAANKLKAQKTINIAGINTGIPNPTGNIADAIKGAYYNAAERAERVRNAAGGAASAGTTGGTAGGAGTPPSGSGGSTGYTFEGPAGEGTAQSGLSGLLGKARKIAPYAAAAGIGYIAGGGGRSGSSDLGDMTTLGGESLVQEETPVADPYQTETIGGYNMEQLEEGYARALAAGDTNAAKQIASLMEVLENRVKRVSAATESASGSNTMSAGMNILNQLYSMYKQMGGSQGVIGGNITNLLNDLSGGAYNADVSTYNQTRALTSSLLARALGEKGTLSDTDRKYINDNLPKVTDAPEVAEKKFRAIYQMLETAAAK